MLVLESPSQYDFLLLLEDDHSIKLTDCILWETNFSHNFRSQDLNNTFTVYELAVHRLSHLEDDPRTATFLTKLAYTYGLRYERFGKIDDLQKGITLTQTEVALTS